MSPHAAFLRAFLRAFQCESPPRGRPPKIALGLLYLALAALAAFPVRAAPPANPGAPRPAIPLDARLDAPPAPAQVLPPERPSTASRPLDTPAPPAVEPPVVETLRLHISRSAASTDPRLLTARQRLLQGELDAARIGFEQFLRHDPHHVPALLALSAIARQQQRPEDARQWLERALAADPTDPAVLAALLGSASGRGDPQAAESRLKGLIASHPECAELHFALGNLLARQQRWPEAQTAYFHAATIDEGNPDYRFNLAISLEHLRQPALAAQHYRLALSAAERRAPAFIPATAGRRLAELAPALRP